MKINEKHINGCIIRKYSADFDFSVQQNTIKFIEKLNLIMKLDSFCVITTGDDKDDGNLYTVELPEKYDLKEIVCDIIKENADILMVGCIYKEESLSVGINLKQKSVCLYVCDDKEELCDEVAKFLSIDI